MYGDTDNKTRVALSIKLFVGLLSVMFSLYLCIQLCSFIEWVVYSSLSLQRYVIYIYIYMQCLRKLFSLQMHIKAGSCRKYWRRQCAPEALRVVICQSVECDDNAFM